MQSALVELFGTFVFVSIVLLSPADILLVAAGLAAAVAFSRHAGPAHLNPAVTTAMYVQRRITAMQYVMFVASQLAGALLAVAWSALA